MASDDDADFDDEAAFDDDDVNQDISDNDDGTNQSEILYTYPQETESFLGDSEFLPKSAKQERARNLLFHAAGSDSPQKVDSSKPVSEEKSVLEKFLDSIPDKTSTCKIEVEGTHTLGKFFAAAPPFASVKDSPTFPLDEQQVVLLKKFWRAQNPTKLTAFSEESFKILKVSDEFVELTKVPTLDEFVKHVNTARGTTTKEGYRVRMWQNFETDMRKIHKGVRVGFLAQALNQRILSNISQLVNEWEEQHVL